MSTVLQATKRKTGVRSELSQLRKGGKVPAVIYGYNIENTPIAVDYKEVAKEVQKRGRTGVFDLDVEGKKVKALIQEVQRDRLNGKVLHIDFLSVNMEEEVEVEVPIHAVGESVGVKEGGVLTQILDTLKIKVKPAEIPEKIDIDISNLGIGDTLFVSDIRERVNYQIIEGDDVTVFTVTSPATARDAGQGDNDNQDIKATEAPESQA
ncbi:50S ribosomal protein L25/general stress protein Ctc [Ureibacillus sp. FSL K6-8385]|uniref:Large ribosomal subunit protein bL25 n=1 Tax=Ureibacillus terrenus TaxID=118246 RepID=A0A540UYA6_9BACL|nr:50S ribosomal protein L25/general stress protein Ctc [Ureibacillus terrenus]MED3662438.1 50S ribosomal protein L25/general stress protein Ctc [Ureibacillus terrenus]MED3763206.1 50S ribosomal protein L25/general stress protein Ctc [Ureibacillus terrenus]TQE89475.1 50S ribosomal protein L25/general stress protein Ctc [Ureibacillus terrenus]